MATKAASFIGTSEVLRFKKEYYLKMDYALLYDSHVPFVGFFWTKIPASHPYNLPNVQLLGPKIPFKHKTE